MKNFTLLNLLNQHIHRDHVVLARVYAHGSWHQFSGQDVCSHMYLATQYWNQIFNLSDKKTKTHTKEKGLTTRKKYKTLIFMTSNSYHAFIASFAAVISGYDVMWLPNQMSAEEINSIGNDLSVMAIVTDIEESIAYWKKINHSVISIQHITWLENSKFLNSEKQKFKQLFKTDLGRFKFMSFGHDGMPIQETIYLSSFIITAQNFIKHCRVPDHILWQSFELMPPSHPFAHLSKFCVLIQNGILGFPSGNDIETSLSILKPTYFFASRIEFEQVSSIFRTYEKNSSTPFQTKTKKAVYQIQRFLGSSKAMKIPENIFSLLKQAVRSTSKLVSANSLLFNGFDNLKFIIHGFSPATKQNVQLFESYGIPVIETYGTTHGAGMLSTNTYKTPHLNMIGHPLDHVDFRLGLHSTLEYKLSYEFNEKNHLWHETGDVVQMTPFGFLLTGRKKHLFTTTGGAIVSPAYIEKLIKENPLIKDVCVVGDQQPYLCALIFVNKEYFVNQNLHYDSNMNYDDLIQSYVQSVITDINQKLPRHVTIKKFYLMDKPFSQENGELLLNGEIDRIGIAENKMHTINELYH